jgi:hypothetical protein
MEPSQSKSFRHTLLRLVFLLQRCDRSSTTHRGMDEVSRQHVILERGRVGEHWRSERWDSFHFQFPNSTIELPGYNYQCDDSDAFAPGSEVVRFLDG